MEVGPATETDLEALVVMRSALWPDSSSVEHRGELSEIVSRTGPGEFPMVCLVAREGRELLGFVEVGLRSHADGCDPHIPCGYLEGWYVRPAHRHRGVGRALVQAAERWARSQGAKEMASDTWMDNEESQRAHSAMGYEVVDRCVNYKKRLT